MKIKAVIFDWAGTTLDRGSLAPIRTLERVFREAGVPILEAEARRDMGIAKRDHIAAILQMERVQHEWVKTQKRASLPTDLDALYQRFIPLQLECLTQYADLIEGVPELTNKLRDQGIKIGSTTGYTRAMLDVLLQAAARQGYRPDCSFTPEDVGAGRPHPFMIYAAAVEMKVYPLRAFVKVGDTVSDIQEGLNAGTWTVGVSATGNCSREILQAAGAHFVIDSVADLIPVLDQIQHHA